MTIILSNITADGVNLVQNDFASGMPAPMSYLGLAAAMAPALGLERWDIRVLPVIHEIDVSPGRPKAAMGPKEGAFRPKEIPEQMTGRVRLSLVLDVPAHVGVEDVAEAFEGKRIAGGLVRRIERVREAFDVADILRAMRRGYALIPPRNADQQFISNGDGEDLHKVADILFPAHKAPGSGWIVPAAVGWRLLEDPATVPARTGTRAPDITHCFAEPVLGFAELLSIRNPYLTGMKPEEFFALFWSWQTPDDWILGHKIYADNLTKEIPHV